MGNVIVNLNMKESYVMPVLMVIMLLIITSQILSVRYVLLVMPVVLKQLQQIMYCSNVINSMVPVNVKMATQAYIVMNVILTMDTLI